MPAIAGNAAEPPLADSYHALLRRGSSCAFVAVAPPAPLPTSDECELPMIDVGCLTSGVDDVPGSAEAGERRAACVAAIAQAAEEWGFFQVCNHGVRPELLEEMRREQARLFRLPFEAKHALLDGSYRWGTPTATSLQQLSWSEAFHVPLAAISGDTCNFGELITLRDVTREVAGAMSKLASTLAGVLAEAVLGHAPASVGERGFPEGCEETTCFLRLNRYPACPFSPDTFGLVPHTDSDFLTVLFQDRVGGLQLMKGGAWVAVKPIPGALIVNIGDLFQAWSNNRYKSVEHRVMANATMERYSVAYFLCPSYDSPIGTCREPSPYVPFTFGQYRWRVQEDVKRTGKKVGLRNFLA